MKTILFSAILLFSVSSFSQTARCKWTIVNDQDSSTVLSPNFKQDAGHPLKYTVAHLCDCACNYLVTITGIIHYVGVNSNSVYWKLFTFPSGLRPSEAYFSSASCAVNTGTYLDCSVSVNEQGDVFLIMEDRPIINGSLIKFTFNFYIP